MRKDISRIQRQPNSRSPLYLSRPVSGQPGAGSRILVQRTTRSTFPPKIPPVSHQGEVLSRVASWLSSRPQATFYLGFGGLGDALLSLAPASTDPKATIVFFANEGSWRFVEKFFALYNIPSLVQGNIMGQVWANEVHRLVTGHPNFCVSGHLADRLDYGDWINENKYASRILGYVDWKARWGQQENPFPTRGVICVGPSGSSRDMNKQRFLSVNEYNALVEKHLGDNYTVCGIGSEEDFTIYGHVRHPHFLWASSDFVVKPTGKREATTLRTLLQIINGAQHIFSVDSWLKTYGLLAGVPTTVIKTRWNNRYKKYGEDITDFVFLNPNIWPKITLATIEELLL